MGVVQQVEATMWSRSSKFPAWIDNVVLAADTAEEYEIPEGVAALLITPVAPVWACLYQAGDTPVVAAAPSDEVDDGNGSIYLSGPAWFRVAGGMKISFYSLAGTSIGIGCYAGS